MIDFNFRKLAKSYFSFLVKNYGYRIIFDKDLEVRFEKNNVLLSIFYDSYTHEIGLTIVNQLKPNDKYPLSTLLKFIDHNEQLIFQASNDEVADRCLKGISLLVKSNLSGLLLGDQDSFIQLEKFYLRDNNTTTRKYTIDPIKENALSAWQKKDYVTVVRLYDSIYSDLSSVEKKRLAYSKKRNDDKTK